MQRLEDRVAPAVDIFTNVFDPAGVLVGEDGDVYVSYIENDLLEGRSVVGKFSPQGVFQGRVIVDRGLIAYPGSMVSLDSGEALILKPDGQVYGFVPETGAVFPVFHIKALTAIDTSSVYDIQEGRTANFGGRIFPYLPDTVYGDIAVSGDDILVTGYSPIRSQGDYLFVLRIRLSDDAPSAKVLVSSSATPVGGHGTGSTSPRGVAVNADGMVLTTLPYAPTGVLPLNFDVPVAFGVDFPEGQGPLPYRPFGNQDVASRGMTTDSQGNFLIATGSVGSSLLGTYHGFLIADAALTDLEGVPVSPDALTSSWDVAVSPEDSHVYLAQANRNQVLRSTYEAPRVETDLLFTVGLDDQVYYQKLGPDGRSASPYILAAPGAVKAIASGRLDDLSPQLFVIGLDDQVYSLTFNRSGFSSGAYRLTQPGGVKSIVIGQAGGDPQLFAIGMDDQVYSQTFRSSGRSTGPYRLTQPGGVKSIAVGQRANRPQLFAIGMDDQVYMQGFGTDGRSTGPYRPTQPGAVKSIAVGQRAGNPQLFAIGMDDQVYSQVFGGDGLSTGPYRLTRPGAVKSIAVGQQGDRPQLFAIGMNNYVYTQTFGLDGLSTGPYRAAQPGAVRSIAVGLTSAESPALYAIGLDDQVYVGLFDRDGDPLRGGYAVTRYGRVKVHGTTR